MKAWHCYLILFISLLCFVNIEAKKPKYKHDLAVCAIFQNDARFLKEWIEFHKLMGATHFFLYNNLSTDNYLEVLQPYIDKGEVELTDWSYPSNTIETWTHIQISAYKNAFRKAVENKVKWLAIIDTDEFVYPVIESDLISFLNKFEDVGGVVVNWQLFGTSHVERIPDNKLMIETLTKKAPEGYEANVFIKSIVRPERVVSMFNPHSVVYKKPYCSVDGEGKLVSGSRNSNIPISKVRINHYWSRDNQFFVERKIERRQKWWSGIDRLLQMLDDMNVMDDYTISRFIPAMRARMKF